MVKLQCDLCGDEKNRIGYNLTVSLLDCRYETSTTKEVGTKPFLLCPACYKKLNLPNIYAKDKKDKERFSIPTDWIKFTTEYNEDYKKEMLSLPLPEDEQEIQCSDGKKVWQDTFMRDGEDCYLDSGLELIKSVTHWQPLPLPPK